MATQGLVVFEGIQREIPGLVTVTDLTANQYFFVKMSADKTVAIAGDDDRPIGVLVNKPLGATGVPVAATVAGPGSITKLKAGNTITFGQKLTPNTDGTAIPVSEATDPVGATALQGASAGDYVLVQVENGLTLAAS